MIISNKNSDRPIEFDEDYPCLKVLTSINQGHRAAYGTVVLFPRPKVGTVVYTTDASRHEVGYTGSSWDEDAFSLYIHEVTLRNMQL